MAGYLRSATQLEADSLRKQLEAIVRYARDRGMQLIRIYCDECSSGLRIDVPSALRQMLRDIESGAGDFDATLLLDPGRWGRFHTPDQSACLEYACRESGIEVHYCARGLDKDQAPVSANWSIRTGTGPGTGFPRNSSARWRRKWRASSAASSGSRRPTAPTT